MLEAYGTHPGLRVACCCDRLQVAADWWRSNVFVKTYRERRTWMAVFRAYYRVYAAHLVLYHAMQAQAFVG